MAIPAKVDMVLEIVIRAVPGAFVRVSLSSVALLTGTHRGFLSDKILRYMCDAHPLEWPLCVQSFTDLSYLVSL